MPDQLSEETPLTLQHILRPLGQGVSAELQHALIGLHLDEAAQQRYEVLAGKNTAGLLDSHERQELEDFVALNRFISTLKAEALLGQRRSVAS